MSIVCFAVYEGSLRPSKRNVG